MDDCFEVITREDGVGEAGQKGHSKTLEKEVEQKVPFKKEKDEGQIRRLMQSLQSMGSSSESTDSSEDDDVKSCSSDGGGGGGGHKDANRTKSPPKPEEDDDDFAVQLAKAGRLKRRHRHCIFIKATFN